MRTRKYISRLRTPGRFQRSARRALNGAWYATTEDARRVIDQIRETFTHYRGAPGNCQRRTKP